MHQSFKTWLAEAKSVLGQYRRARVRYVKARYSGEPRSEQLAWEALERARYMFCACGGDNPFAQDAADGVLLTPSWETRHKWTA